MSTSQRRFINALGEQVPVSVELAGVQFGDSVFETMLVLGREIAHWDLHAKRLQSGLARLQIIFPQAILDTEITSVLNQLDENRCYRLRLQVARGLPGSYQGYSCPTDNSVASITLSTIEKPLAAQCDLMLCKTRLAPQPLLAGIKHSARIEQVLCRREQERAQASWSEQILEGVVCDHEAHVVEAISANIFLRIGQQWLTPDLAHCGVEGIARSVILQRIMPELDINCRIKTIGLAMLQSAEQVLICSAIAGVKLVEQLWLSQDSRIKFQLNGQAEQIQQAWFNNL